MQKSSPSSYFPYGFAGIGPHCAGPGGDFAPLPLGSMQAAVEPAWVRAGWGWGASGGVRTLNLPALLLNKSP